MSKKQINNIKPFASVLVLMFFLFVFAFIQMENRRMGYSFIQLTAKEKQMRNHHRQKMLHLAKMKGAERVRLLATQRLPMKKAVDGQIIQMTSSGVAIVQ